MSVDGLDAAKAAEVQEAARSYASAVLVAHDADRRRAEARALVARTARDAEEAGEDRDRAWGRLVELTGREVADE